MKKLRAATEEIFQNQWKRKLEASTKCDTYRLFKDTMKFEDYLLHPNRNKRILMTKLRTSDHKLMIELGRHNRPITPREERVCHMCTNKTEDEIHFFTECTMYGSKNKFWNQVHQRFPQTLHLNTRERFIFIMTQEDPEITKTLLDTSREWYGLRTFLCNYFYQ